MEKPTKKKLKQILNSLTLQENITRPPLLMETSMGKSMKNSLSNQGLYLLTCQINNIVKKEKFNIKQNSKYLEQQDFKEMKHNLNAYGKNPKLFKMDKIIRMTRQPPPPLKNIIKIHQNRFTIAKQYNTQLSQKIDAIMQSESILKIKKAKKQHLQNRIQAPLVKQLRKLRSTHQIGKTQRIDSSNLLKRKGRSAWTQRKYQNGNRSIDEQKYNQKIFLQKNEKYQSTYNFDKKANKNNKQINVDNKPFHKYNYRQDIYQNKYFLKQDPDKRLKRKALQYFA